MYEKYKKYLIGGAIGFVAGLLIKIALPLIIILTGCALVYVYYNRDTNR